MRRSDEPGEQLLRQEADSHRLQLLIPDSQLPLGKRSLMEQLRTVKQRLRGAFHGIQGAFHDKGLERAFFHR